MRHAFKFDRNAAQFLLPQDFYEKTPASLPGLVVMA